MVLPHIKGISEKTEQICHPFNIKVNFQTSTIKKLRVHIRQTVSMEKKKGVVPCMDCNSVYVDEIGRNLEKKIEETSVCN